jgi:hypothetical protein
VDRVLHALVPGVSDLLTAFVQVEQIETGVIRVADDAEGVCPLPHLTSEVVASISCRLVSLRVEPGFAEDLQAP